MTAARAGRRASASRAPGRRVHTLRATGDRATASTRCFARSWAPGDRVARQATAFRRRRFLRCLAEVPAICAVSARTAASRAFGRLRTDRFERAHEGSVSSASAPAPGSAPKVHQVDGWQEHEPDPPGRDRSVPPRPIHPAATDLPGRDGLHDHCSVLGTRYDGARAPVAQWTERGRPKACVGGSSPSGGAISKSLADAKKGSAAGTSSMSCTFPSFSDTLLTTSWMSRRSCAGEARSKPGSDRSSGHTDTQAQGIDRAREMVGNSGGGDVVIHGRDGPIRDSDTVAPGNDPNPPKDRK